jgi:hypothetical protein
VVFTYAAEHGREEELEPGQKVGNSVGKEHDARRSDKQKNKAGHLKIASKTTMSFVLNEKPDRENDPR